MDWQTVFAGVAALVAAGALRSQIKQAHDTRAWEADQARRRERFEKSMARRQEEWQEKQETQRKRERAEDLLRIEQSTTAQLKVTLEDVQVIYDKPELRADDSEYQKAPTAPYLKVEMRNVGQVSVTLNPPYLITDNNVRLSEKPALNIDYLEDSHTYYPCDLAPGKSLTAHFSPFPLATELVKQDYAGETALRAVVEDQVGGAHRSEPLITNIDWWLEVSDRSW
jgi:hypothetical protein